MVKWSEARRSTLRSMWLAGRTSGEISAALGDVSRNAVMGMVDRMGLLRNRDHAANSVARITGCCAPQWRRDNQAASEVAAPSAALVDPAQVETVVLEPEIVVAGPPSDPAPVETVTPEPVVVVAAPVESVLPVDAADPTPTDADESETEDDEEDIEEQKEEVEEDVSEDDPVPLDHAAANEDDVDDDADAADRSAKVGIDRIRAAVRATATRPPSSRTWRPSSPLSRMPPSRREVPEPPAVSISSGVMARIANGSSTGPETHQVFGALEELTGLPFDENVPGHVPALVAIATILAKGDPRPLLAPRVPEQAVLRVMRAFAGNGAVIAGKPPTRWTQDVDDAAFYEEMVRTAA